MKVIYNLKITIILITILFITISLNAQVGIGTTNPDASSMLDVQSTVKGMLIPRMTTAEKAAISTPANGLLVYDTTTKSLWFYNATATTPVWQELSGSSISDADGNTKVEVEQSENEDKIRLSAAGTEFMQIDSNGDIKLGDRGPSTLTGGPLGLVDSDQAGLENYTKITSDGSLSYVGNATRWEDLKIPVNAVTKKEGDTDPATFDVFVDGLAALKFKNDKDRSVFFTLQLPHGWKEGSNIFPHVHWSVQSNIANPDTQGVVWSLEYRWASLAQKFNDNATSPLTLVSGQAVAAPNAVGGVEAYEHVITPLNIHSVDGLLTTGVDATGKTLSSMLICRLFRDVSDTYSGDDVFLLEIDFHYQVDSDGSNQEYTKE